MNILLQFPEGLKSKALKYTEKYNGNIFISGSKSYGGCDVALQEADAIGAEKIIHFGHSEFPLNPIIREKYKHIKIEYVEFHVNVDHKLIKKLAEILKQRQLKKPILATTVQHTNQIDDFIKILKDNRINPITGMGLKTVHRAQILGCDISSVLSVIDRGDCVVYIGGGRFHYLALNTQLPVISVNPYTNELKDVSEEIDRYNRQRQGLVAKASEAKVFGILVSTRPGQFNINLAESIKRHLEAKGKRAEIVISREIDWEALQNFNCFDAFVNTACPRISDDWKRINKPIINPDELGLLFELFPD
ncbi:diphthamide biosynthesis enzyme Dph2 [Candidatus Micrarchaeota archaeon]|nr:diphthamide biosynthesis enzyme Dph2 [Candidatus Micrarchaeota archaeon]